MEQVVRHHQPAHQGQLRFQDPMVQLLDHLVLLVQQVLLELPASLEQVQEVLALAEPLALEEPLEELELVLDQGLHQQEEEGERMW